MSLLPSGVMETPSNAYFVKNDLSNDQVVQTPPNELGLNIPAGGGLRSVSLGTVNLKPGNYQITMPFTIELPTGNVSADLFYVAVRTNKTPFIYLASSTVPPNSVYTGTGWYGSVTYTHRLSGHYEIIGTATQYNLSSTNSYNIFWNYVTFQYLGP